MSLQKKQNALVEEINGLGDCFEQYSYLIFRSGQMPEMDDCYKTEENLIRGCQSVVWVQIDIKDGKMYFQADSETLIIRGILAILTELVHGERIAEIAKTPIDIFERTQLAVTFQSDRLSGIQNIIKRIYDAAES